jgi:uncharacterized protein (TIGR02246 family)
MNITKRNVNIILLSGCVFAVLVLFAPVAGAGPAEEVAEVSRPRLQYLKEGNAEAYSAAYADNAVFHSSFSPFRIEGKEAIRAYFTELFRLYPKRETFIRHPMTRVYNDNLVISDSYAVLNWTEEEGDIETYNTRVSVVWCKVGGRWQIVEQHTSRLPAAD